MARQSRESLATLREQVTSKGGTTAAALAGARCAPAFVLSSRTRWRRPIAARPNSPPNSAPLKHRAHGSDQIHRRYAALAADCWPSCCVCCSSWVRADFRDPMADAIVRVTNWLILPLRRVLPPVGKIDTATVRGGAR